jgi:hypothetical protein
MNILLLILITLVAGALFYGVLMPSAMNGSLTRWSKSFGKYWKLAISMNKELGGYVHDTAMSQFIAPNTFHVATGTWTMVAGQVAHTISYHKAAANETTVVSIPIHVPSNSVAGKGAYLKSVEIDYEITIAEPTSITPLVNLVTRGADTAVATVAAQTFTQSPAAASAKTVEQHKLVLTITSPFWIDNDQYVLVELSIPTGAGGCVLDFYGAVANFTLRM